MGKIHDGNINGMCMIKDGQYLFTASDEGNFKQFDIKKQSLVKDYGPVFNTICSIIC